MTHTVRRFAPDEWPLYRDLRLRALQESPTAFGSTYAHELQRTEAEWALRLSRGATSPRDLPLVAEVNGEPSGLAWARFEEDSPQVVHLHQMWVVPERRNHGVGRALVEAAVSWSRAVGARALVLDVTTDNTSAQRLYERSGFVAIGDPKPLRPGSTLQARSMHLVLRADTSASSA